MQYIFVYLFKKKIIYVNLFLIFPNKHILYKINILYWKSSESDNGYLFEFWILLLLYVTLMDSWGCVLRRKEWTPHWALLETAVALRNGTLGLMHNQMWINSMVEWGPQ